MVGSSFNLVVLSLKVIRNNKATFSLRTSDNDGPGVILSHYVSKEQTLLTDDKL